MRLLALFLFYFYLFIVVVVVVVVGISSCAYRFLRQLLRSIGIAQRFRLCMYEVVFVRMTKVRRTNARWYQVILESAS